MQRVRFVDELVDFERICRVCASEREREREAQAQLELA